MCCGYSLKKRLINKFTYNIGKESGSYIANYDNFRWR